jgi:hypothetical protein
MPQRCRRCNECPKTSRIQSPVQQPMPREGSVRRYNTARTDRRTHTCTRAHARMHARAGGRAGSVTPPPRAAAHVVELERHRRHRRWRRHRLLARALLERRKLCAERGRTASDAIQNIPTVHRRSLVHSKERCRMEGERSAQSTLRVLRSTPWYPFSTLQARQGPRHGQRSSGLGCTAAC